MGGADNVGESDVTVVTAGKAGGLSSEKGLGIYETALNRAHYARGSTGC
jgi:hypothetical protein